MRSVAGKLKLDLAQYQEVARFARHLILPAIALFPFHVTAIMFHITTIAAVAACSHSTFNGP